MTTLNNMRKIQNRNYNGISRMLGIAVCLLFSYYANAATYYSIANTAWNVATTWSTVGYGGTASASAPTLATDIINIGDSKTVTIPGGTTVSSASITIDATGTLTNASTSAITTASWVCNGTYNHATSAATLPLGTTTTSWAANSNLNITGSYTAATVFLNFENQTFGNFTFNPATMSNTVSLVGAAGTTTVQGNFTITQTGTSTLYMRIYGQQFANTLNINGNFIQSAGIYDLHNGGPTATVQIFNLKGNFTLSGTSVLTQTTTQSGSTVGINFIGTGVQTLSISPTASITSQATTPTCAIQFNVASGSTIDMGTSVLTGTNNTSFILSPGATIITANTGGISASGASGSIQVAGTRNYSTSANYTYNGSSAQITGTGLPSSVNNLTISNNAGVTFSAAETVTGTLAMGSSSVANLNAFAIATNAFTVGGVSKANGTYGGTGSGASTILSNFTANAGTLNVSCIFDTWTGATSTDWNTDSNWSCGIPSSATNVTINSGGNQPIIAASASCANITLNSGSTLTISGSNTLTVSGNWINSGTFTPNSGTVIFNNAAQTISGATTFNNVTIGGSGVKTITTGNFTVNAILSMEGTATLSAVPTYGAAATLQYNTSTARTAGVEWISPFVATGGVLINSTGAISLNAAKVFNVSIRLSINTGATLTPGANLLTLGGDLNNDGTITSGTFGLTINGTAATQNIDGFTTSGTVSMTKTAGTATLTGNVSGGAFTLNGIGGTINLGTGLTHTFSGTFTKTNGTINLNSSTLNINGTTSGTGGTWTQGTSTVVYGGTAQTVFGVNYYNLTLSGSGTKTFAAATTNNNISINTGVVASLGTGLTHSANALYFAGALQNPGTWGGSSSTAANVNTTYFTTATGIISIANVWTGATNTDWNTTTNWSEGIVPTTAWDVIIPVVTNQPIIGTTAYCNNITINTGASLTISGSNSLSVNSKWANSGTFTANSSTVLFNGAAQSITGSTTFNNVIIGGSAAKTITTANFIVNGILSMEGTATISAAPTYSSTATLQYNTSTARTAGSEWISGFSASGGIIIGNTGAITLNSAEILNATAPLTLNSGATLAMSTFLLTLNGNFINNGGTTSGSGGVTIAGTATQSIGSFTTTGTVSMTKTAGTATFTGNINGGPLTINGTGGTLNLGSGLTHTFTGNINLTAGTLNGGSSILNVNYTSTTAWTGTGSNFTAGTSTVVFGGGAQTLAATPTIFYNLTLAGSGTKTWTTPNTPTISNILSMEGTAIVSIVPTFGTNATLQYNTATARTAGLEWITPFAATGGIFITNTGIITLNNAKVLNANIPLSINFGANLATANLQITFGGDFINSGTFTAGSSAIVITNTASTQNIGAFTTTGAVSMTKTAGTATLLGNVNAGALTINGTGGTLNLGTALTHTFTGNITLTAGTLNGGSSILQANSSTTSAWTGTGSNFTAGTGTVSFGGVAQTINTATTFNNLILTGSGTKTFGAIITTPGAFSIRSGVLVNLGTFVSPAHTAGYLYEAGVNKLTGSYGSTASPATYKDATYFGTSATGILNVTASTGCSGGNNTWTGSVSTDWNTAGNWCGGIPTSASNVIIPSGGNQPTISSSAICAGININSGATLSISGTNTLTVKGDWQNDGTFTANSSTVNFNSLAAQSIVGASTTTFNNLTISNGGTVTLTTIPVVNGILSMEGAPLLSAPTYGSAATLQYNSSTAQTVGSEWISPFLSSGGVVIKNLGVITLNGAKQLGNNTSVPLNINTGATLATANFGLIFHGDFINSGTFTAGSSTITIDATISAQNIGKFTTTGGVTCSKSSGTATLTGNINAASLTNSTSGGTLNLGAGLTHTISGAWVRTNGTVNGGSSTLNIGGNVTNVAGTFTAGTSTVNYNGVDQITASVNYYNLILSGSGTKTMQSGTSSIGNNFTLSGTASATIASNLAISGNLTVGSGTTLANSTNYTLAVTGTTSVTGTYTDGSIGNKTFTADVTLNSGAVWNETAVSAYSIAGNFTNNASTFTSNSGVHTFTGSGKTLSGTTAISIPATTISGTYTNNGTLTVNTALTGSGTLTQGVGSTLNIGGTATISTLAAGSNSNTVNYSGASQSILPITYYHLTLSGSGTETLTSISTINGNFTTSGTVSVNAATALSIAGNVNIGSTSGFVAGSYTHNVGGNWTKNGAFTATGSTINFNGTGSQTITANVANFNNIIFSGSGTISAAGTLGIDGNLTINSNFSAGNYTHTLKGNWTNNGSFTAGSGTISLISNSSQSIAGTSSTTFNSLGMNGIGGASLGIATSVAGTLTLNLSKIDIGSYNLTITPTGAVSGGSSTSYVKTSGNGRLKQQIVGQATISYPVGNSAYNPIIVTNNGTNSTDNYSIRIGEGTITNANSTKTVNRQWYIMKDVVASTNLTVTATFNSGEEGTGFNNSTSPAIGYYDGSTWAYRSINSGSGTRTFTALGSAPDMSNPNGYLALGSGDAFNASKLSITVLPPTPYRGQNSSIATIQALNSNNVPTYINTATTFDLTSNVSFQRTGGLTGFTLAANTYQTIINNIQFNVSTWNDTDKAYDLTATVTATGTSGESLTAGVTPNFAIKEGSIYQPLTSGNWSNVQWQKSTDGGTSWANTTLPANNVFAETDLIQIPVGINLTADVISSFYSLLVFGTMNINSSGTLTINHTTSNLSDYDLEVYGTLENSGGSLINSNLSYVAVEFIGGTYWHNVNGGSIPTATWNSLNGTLSSCNVTGITSTQVSGLNQSFQNFTWNNSAQAVIQYINGDMNVSGSLILTNGVLSTDVNHVIEAANGSITRTNGYINGNLRLYVPNTSAPTIFFPIGDTNYYAPISIAFVGNVSGSGYFDASTTAAKPAYESGLSQTKYINRKWTINNYGVGGFSSFTPTFTFDNNDEVGSPTLSNLVVRKLSASTWYALATSQSGNSVSCSGQTTFSDFYVGESDCSSTNSIWLGSISTDWNTGSNWCSGSVPTSTTNVSIPSSPTNQPIISSTATCANLTILSGANLTISGTNTLDVKANWTNSGTFTANSGTVSFTGSSTQTISGVSSFFNLTINNSAGVTSVNDLTVNGLLTLTSSNPDATHGTLDMGNNILSMLTASAAVSGSGDVSGIVKRTHTFTANNQYSFGSQYTTLNFLGTGTQPSEITCRISLGSTLPDKPNAILRHYSFSQTGTTGTDKVTINLRYLTSELNGNTESNLVMWDRHFSGNVEEHGKTNNSTVNHWVGLSGLAISYLAQTTLDNKNLGLANYTAAKNTWVGGADTDWSNSANWTAGHAPYSTDDVLVPDVTTGSNHFPVLTSNVEIHTLEIAANASLTASSYTLAINGYTSAWQNNGTFNPGTGTVSLTHGILTDIVSISGTGVNQFNDINIAANTFIKPGSGVLLKISGMVYGDVTSIADLSTLGNTVEYNGADQYIVNPLTPGFNFSGYYNLTISGSGTKTLIDNLTISGSFVNNGSLATGTGTVSFVGIAPQTISGTTASVFNNVTVSNVFGVTSNTDLTINGVLNLTANPSNSKGALDMGSNTITYGDLATNTGVGDVTGNNSRNNMVASKLYTFGNPYSSIVFAPNVGTIPSNITMNVNLGAAPDWKTSAVKRIYALSETGNSNTKATIRMHYLDTELNGNTEELLIPWVYLNSTAYPGTTRSSFDLVNDFITLSNVNFTFTSGTQFTLANTIVSSCTWTGAVSTDWNDATNWFNAILPTPTSNVIIPDATTLPYTPSLATDTISTIYIQKAGILNSVSDAQLTLKGNAGTWNNDGTFNPNTSTVIFANGTDATVSGTTNFYNITISSGTRLANQSGSVIGIAGAVTNNGTWSTVSQGVSTVNYNGGNQTIVIPDGSTNRYYNLILSGTGTKTMPSHALDVVGDFTISGTASATMSGLMNFDGNVTLGSGSSFTAGSFTHNVIGNWTNNGSTLDNSGSTFNFNGTGTQTIGGTSTNTFNNLNINDSTTVYFSSNLALSGTLTIPNSSTLVHLGANLTNNGTVNIGSATVIFDGTTAQIINGSSMSTFNNVTISNLTGVTANTDQTVNGILNLTTNPDATHGALDMGSNTLNMGISATNIGIGDVTGIVKRQHTFTAGVVYTFGNPYTSIDFLNVSGSAKPGWISLKTTIGAAPSWNSSAIKRIYSFAQEAGGTDRTITSLHYLDSELNGITDETKLVYWDAYTGPTYSSHYPRSHTNFSTDNNWIGLTGMAINFMAPSSTLDYKQWSLGYSNIDKIIWTGNGSPTYSGDWNLPGNWNGGVPTANDDVVIPATADLPGDTHGLPSRNLLSSPAVCKSLEIKSGSTLTVDNYNITVYGSTGAWLNNGTFIPGTGSVIFANGSTSNTVTIAGTTNFNNLTVNDNTQIQPATGSVIRIAGNISQGSGSILDFNSTNNTIEFNGTSDQTVITPHAGYYNLTLSGNSTKTLPVIPLTTVGDLTINGTSTVVNAANTMSIGNALSVANGTVLDMKTYKLNSVSSTSGTGTVKTQNTSSLPIPSAKTWAGTLIYNGTEAQTAVAGTFNNLTCDNGAELDLNDSVTVSGTLLINSSKEMDITPGAKMVANQITNNAGTSGLYVLANSTGANGTLIFNNSENSPVSATVGMYSKAAASTYSNGRYSNYKWQFFGVPLQSVSANPTFIGSYVRKQEESGTGSSTLWVTQGNSSVLVPFAGYEITQANPTTIYFEGQLVNSNYSAALSYSPNAMYPGQHLLGNPYTAAIDISKLDFGSQMDSCVYLYNTGSWDDWNNNKNSGSGENPGQYAAAPQKTAGIAGIPGQVPSMQGFLVAAKSSSQNATIGIPYSSVIRNTTKQRVRSINSITTDKIYTRIDITGTRFSDKMWIFTDPTCTRGYDNGWDGYKFLGSSLAPQLWAMESSGDYQVDAVSDINNTNLGFISGEDTNYTLTFTHENLNLQYTALYLVDLLDPNNPVFADITPNGSTYSFSAVQSSTPVSRFKIVTSPGIATGVSNTDNKSLNIFTNQDGKVFILNPADLTGNVVIYDMAGKALLSAKVNGGGLTTIPSSLVPGCYMLSVVIGNEKVNRKVIIK